MKVDLERPGIRNLACDKSSPTLTSPVRSAKLRTRQMVKPGRFTEDQDAPEHGGREFQCPWAIANGLRHILMERMEEVLGEGTLEASEELLAATTEQSHRRSVLNPPVGLTRGAKVRCRRRFTEVVVDETRDDVARP